ncbi:MAG: signal peptidase II, partial [Victivallales bacterium]|nr:signal peptidase II [Victivallales bacterium]
VHVRNTGSAWGMFSQHTWALALCSVAAFAILIWKFRKWNEGSRPTALALALLQGGIAGNMLDRVVRHSVIDFLSFHWDSHEFPAFNIADSAITVSVILLLLLSFWRPDTSQGQEKPTPAQEK